MTTPTPHDLPTLDVFDDYWSDDPHPHLDAARDSSPLAASQRGIELLTYSGAQGLLRDRRLQTDHMSVVAAVGIRHGEVFDFKQRMLLSQQGDQHMKLRLPLARHFGPSKVEPLRTGIRGIIDTLLDEIDPTEPVNLFEALFNRIPAEVYCTWVNAPRSDAAFVSRMSDKVLTVFQADPAYRDSIEAGYAELFPYVRERIRERRADLGDDILSALIRLEQAGQLTPEELVDEATALLEASTDNTAHQMGLIVGDLLDRPDQWRQLSRDRSRVADAVDEGIRYSPRTRVVQRTAVQAVEISGFEFPAGTVFNATVVAGHRDPDKFDAPHTFDIARPAAPALTFGGGAYACIGIHIAKIEMQEALDALLARFPRMQLAAPAVRRPNAYVATIPDIPVVLAPR